MFQSVCKFLRIVLSRHSISILGVLVKSDVSTRREFTVTLLTIWQKFPKFLRGNQVIHQLICKFQISGYFHAAVHLLLPFRMGSRNRLFFRAFPLEVFRKLKGRPSHFLREKPRRRGWWCLGIVYNSLIFTNVKRLQVSVTKRVFKIYCYEKKNR